MTQPIVVPPDESPLDVPVDPEPDEQPEPDESGGESQLDAAEESLAPVVGASFAGY